MAAQKWTCPFCNRPTTITDNDTDGRDSSHFTGTKYGFVGTSLSAIRCPNPDCGEVYLEFSFNKIQHRMVAPYGHVITECIDTWTLRPESMAKMQPEYIPPQLREDYYEACLIAEKSPKASATLSRRCLQGMIRDRWKISKNTLFEEINELENIVDDDTWEAIKAVKDVGNIGAHMEKDINLIIPVDPDEAKLLIEMIEELFDVWYVQRHERQQKKAKLKQLAKDKNNQRKQNPAP